MNSFFDYSNLKVRFNNKLYNLCAVEESLNAFKEFFWIQKIEIEESYIVVELNFLDKPGDIFAVREFCNYVLGAYAK